MDNKRKVLKSAFIETIPVLFGYLFMGIAFGLLLQKLGYNFIFAIFISVLIYAGAMQFVLLTFLTNPVNLMYVALMTFVVNSRQIFFGISLIDEVKKMGKKGFYAIFGLTDETYSLLCLNKEKSDYTPLKGFYIVFLDHIYWIAGCTIGGIIGQLIKFDTTGIEFSMTALFVVIFVEQWTSMKNHKPTLIGLLCGVLALAIFGAEKFILPALIILVFILITFKSIDNKEVTMSDN